MCDPLMKYLVFGIVNVITGAVLMLYGQLWGEYMCIGGTVVIALSSSSFSRTPNKEPNKDPNKEPNKDPNKEPVNVVKDVEDPTPNMQAMMDRDVALAVEFIRGNDDQDNIIAMYKRGPPEDTGFMWLPNDWFTSEQQQGFQVMKNWILDHDYDSSAYGWMHRAIQQKVRELW